MDKPKPFSYRNPPAWPDDKPTITLKPIADARVSIKYPDRNEGANGSLSMDGGATSMGDEGYGMIYLKFDLSGIPAQQLLAANLRLQCLGPGSADAGKVYIVDPDWDEREITWSQRPEPKRRIAQIGAVGEKEQITRQIALVDPDTKILSIAIVPSSTDGIR